MHALQMYNNNAMHVKYFLKFIFQSIFKLNLSRTGRNKLTACSANFFYNYKILSCQIIYHLAYYNFISPANNMRTSF